MGIKKALACGEGLKGSDEIEFRKGPEETTRKSGLFTAPSFRGTTLWCMGSIVGILTAVKARRNRSFPR